MSFNIEEENKLSLSDKIRNYFLSTRREVHLNSSSSSNELDESFQRILTEKRFPSSINSKMTDNCKQMVLSYDSDDEQIGDTTQQRQEIEVMNQLFNEFGITNSNQTDLLDFESEPLAMANVSRVKMFGLMRPSTVIEESHSWMTTDSLHSSTQDKKSELSKDSLNSPDNSITNIDLTIDSPVNVSLTSDSYGTKKNLSISEKKTPKIDSYQPPSIPWRQTPNLEMSTSHLRSTTPNTPCLLSTTPRTPNSLLTASKTSRLLATTPITPCLPSPTPKTSSEFIDSETEGTSVLLDDTLNEVEYVPDPDQYILKLVDKKNRILSPVPQFDASVRTTSRSTCTTPIRSPKTRVDTPIKKISQSTCMTPTYTPNGSLFIIDSSPDIDQTPMVDTTPKRIYDSIKLKEEKKSNVFPEKTLEIANKKHNDSIGSSKYSFVTAKSTLGVNSNSTDVIELSDDDDDDGKIVDEMVEDEDMGLTANTLDDCSSILTDETASTKGLSHKFPDANDNDKENSTVDTSGHTLDFNDTLEEVEYMMEQAKKMNINASIYTPTKSTISQQLTPSKVMLKSSDQKMHAITPLNRIRPKTPATIILKEKNSNSPSKAIEKPFKNPEIIMPTKEWSSTSKIPRPKIKTPSAKSKSKFDHVVSPIGVYIKNYETIPAIVNCPSGKEFYNSTICREMEKKLNFSTDSMYDGVGSSSVNYKPVTLPKKAYISTGNSQLFDDRTVKTTCGEKLDRLIGNQPIMIAHKGKIKSGHNEVNVADDTLADLSILSGDISMKVVRDVKRV